MNYLKRARFSPYVPWRLLGIFFLMDVVLMFYSLTRPDLAAGFEHPDSALFTGMMISTLTPLLSGIFCVKGISWHPVEPGSVRQMRRFSPLLWGVSGFCYAFGQLIWSIQIFMTQQVPPYPNVAHIIEILPILCVIGGILLLPASGLSLLARLRILLDSLIIMAIVTTLSYYFLLAPLLVKGHGTLEAKVVGGIYPALDLVLMLSVLVVALRSGERVLRPVLIMLGIAAILQFTVDVSHLYEMLDKHYKQFSIAWATMVWYGMLMIGAAQTVNNILKKGEKNGTPVVQQEDMLHPGVLWKNTLSSVLVLIFGLLVFKVWLQGGQAFPGQIVIVYTGGFVVLILMVLRQFLAMYQIMVLQRKLQLKNSSLDELNEQLEKQATTDPLTNLLNHRALAERLDELLGQAQATQSPCSVIFMDLDHFKDLNDHYGHLFGDALLDYFAQVVAATVRTGDVVGRWGGEEFVAILPGMGLEEAFQMAERIRVAVSQRVPDRAGSLNLTCSLGVATYPQDASERKDLLRHADQAMYVAKRLGRNQTYTAHESLVLTNKAATCVTEECEEASMAEIAETLLALLDARDPALSRHGRRVAELASKLAQELGLSREEAHVIYLGGLLHDLGDIAQPDAFLFQDLHVGEKELESRIRYPVIGADILSPVPALRSLAAIVRGHCEWMDGSGYPDGLAGEEIPLGARIVAVASAYDILASKRYSRRVRVSEAALKELRRQAGSRFDPCVVEVLARIVIGAPRVSRTDVA
jgi:diguanylate cyclase (GGDEF)-like protein